MIHIMKKMKCIWLKLNYILLKSKVPGNFLLENISWIRRSYWNGFKWNTYQNFNFRYHHKQNKISLQSWQRFSSVRHKILKFHLFVSFVIFGKTYLNVNIASTFKLHSLQTCPTFCCFFYNSVRWRDVISLFAYDYWISGLMIHQRFSIVISIFTNK